MLLRQVKQKMPRTAGCLHQGDMCIILPEVRATERSTVMYQSDCWERVQPGKLLMVAGCEEEQADTSSEGSQGQLADLACVCHLPGRAGSSHPGDAWHLGPECSHWVHHNRPGLHRPPERHLGAENQTSSASHL